GNQPAGKSPGVSRNPTLANRLGTIYCPVSSYIRTSSYLFL
ncbi:hypothetical protein AVDCRST_MAG81-2542, partial [uncultured Synechococcales cyanobacterium]